MFKHSEIWMVSLMFSEFSLYFKYLIQSHCLSLCFTLYFSSDFLKQKWNVTKVSNNYSLVAWLPVAVEGNTKT